MHILGYRANRLNFSYRDPVMLSAMHTLVRNPFDPKETQNTIRETLAHCYAEHASDEELNTAALLGEISEVNCDDFENFLDAAAQVTNGVSQHTPEFERLLQQSLPLIHQSMSSIASKGRLKPASEFHPVVKLAQSLAMGRMH